MSDIEEAHEAELFAPLTFDAQGRPSIRFPKGHPGHGDVEYQRQREAIAAAALRYRPGDPLPRIDYQPHDDLTWQRISTALGELLRECGAREVLDAVRRFALPVDRVPQLSETSARLQRLTGFRFEPAAGIVPLRLFYGSLADRVFNATQFVRHGSQPLFSPEPDMVHEVIGHGTTLASPRLAELYAQAGHAARRVHTEEALEAVSRVFWFTLEYGVLLESGEPKAYGASLLSSYGELRAFRSARIRPLDLRAMVNQVYDVTKPQPVLFAARSLDELEDFLGRFFSTVDDDTPAELLPAR